MYLIITFRRGDPCLQAGEEAPPPFEFNVNTLKFYLLGLSTGCDPSPMLEGVSCRQHCSYLSELLTIGRRARD